MRQVFCPQDRLFRIDETFRQFLISRSRMDTGQRDISEDGREDVVEIMGNSPGKYTY